MNNRFKKTIKAFSLLEVMVSMAIIGIIMAMLSNILVNSIIISQKSIARSFVREEVSDILDRVAADVRDANTISSCTGTLQTAKCDMVLDAPVSWQTCVNSVGGYDVCKKDASGNILFSSSPTLKLTSLIFDQGYDTGTNTIRKNILITIVADHQNTATGVKNILRQTSVSTRNYELINPGTIVGGSPVVGVNTFGNGSDGALNVSGTFNLQTSSSGARTYPDGIAYRVVAPVAGANTVTRFAASYSLNSGITAGDSVLVINMQGAGVDIASVGNYEVMTVQSVTADTITFTAALQKSYAGTTAANQKVMVQRIPNYTDVTLDNGDTMTTRNWTRATVPGAPPAGGTTRTHHQGHIYNDKIYLVEGCNVIPCGYLATVDIFDTNTNTWSTGANTTSARAGTASILFNGKIYVYGGTNGTNRNTTIIYDIESNTWSAGVTGGTARRFSQAVQYNSKMYVYGGYTTTATNILDIFDIPSGTWSVGTAGGTTRYSFSAATYNGKLYTWGGCTGSGGCATAMINTMDIFDFATNTWSTGATGGTARYGAAATVYNGKIYFFAGCSSGPTARNIIDIYDIASNTWSTGTAGGTARCYPTVEVNGNLAYLNGGNGAGGGTHNAIDVYDFDSGQWNAGNGYGTGILAFKASGNVTVKTGGKIISENSGFRTRGFQGGYGFQGESTSGTGTYNQYLRLSQGGGGSGQEYVGCNIFSSAGAGGYGTAGGTGNSYFCSGVGTAPGGQGGSAYGLPDLTKIYLGSGGGSGNNTGGSGGAGGGGGGIVMIWGRNLTVQGTVSTKGGAATASTTGSGGSGGAGGSIYIATIVGNIGTSLITSMGGAGGTGSTGVNGRSGGVGRIAIYYNTSLTGTTNPAAYSQQFTPN